jgi:hypothetical protein
MWDRQPFANLRASTACTGITLPFFTYNINPLHVKTIPNSKTTTPILPKSEDLTQLFTATLRYADLGPFWEEGGGYITSLPTAT